jgi:hypothetical protein
MTTAADPHEEFEIAALRRARGALDGDLTRRLEAHLSSCDSCRSFAAAAEATAGALRGLARTATSSRDWDAMRSAFRAHRNARRRGARTAWALTPPLVAVLLWTLSPPLSWCLVAWLIVMLVLASRSDANEARRARLAGVVSADLLAFYRADLDREIALIRKSKPLFPMLAVSFGLMIVASLALLVKALIADDRPFDEPQLLMPLVVLPIVFAWLWRRVRVVLPRLERERKELDA